jgi:hypothetical protein
MIIKAFVNDTPEDRAYERVALSPWLRLRLGYWRFWTNRAFDARDKHELGTWQWLKANERVEKRLL